MDKRTLVLRDTKWLEIVKACNESGMTKTEWCREHGIREKSFYYHQTKIRRAMIAAIDSKETNSSAESVGKSSRALVPGQITELSLCKRNESDMPDSAQFVPDAVINAGNTRIELSNSISEKLLTALIKNICHAE